MSVIVKPMSIVVSALLLVLRVNVAVAEPAKSDARHSLQARSDQMLNIPSANFDGRGILQQVDARSNRLLIDALSYRFDPNMKVHTLHTQFATVHSLRGEMEVGFTLGSGSGLTITEIWQLPAGSVVRQ